MPSAPLWKPCIAGTLLSAKQDIAHGVLGDPPHEPECNKGVGCHTAGAPPPEPAAALHPARPAAWDPFEPATEEECNMSALDFANSRVFGNAAFRPQQREVIQAVMQARASAGLGLE